MFRTLRQNKGKKQGYAVFGELFRCGVCLSLECGLRGAGQKIIRRVERGVKDELVGGMVVSEREGVGEIGNVE